MCQGGIKSTQRTQEQQLEYLGSWQRLGVGSTGGSGEGLPATISRPRGTAAAVDPVHYSVYEESWAARRTFGRPQTKRLCRDRQPRAGRPTARGQRCIM